MIKQRAFELERAGHYAKACAAWAAVVRESGPSAEAFERMAACCERIPDHQGPAVVPPLW